MRFLTFFFLAAVSASSRALKFVPEEGDEGRHLGNKGGYGHIQDDFCELCIELKDGNTKNGSKLWWNTCKKGKKAQLWRFDKVRPTKNCEGPRGKIHSKLDDEKCWQVYKKYKPLSRLRIHDCNNKRDHQKWNFCLDGIRPKQLKESDGLFVYSPKPNGAKKGDPVVLSDRNTWSLDFNKNIEECNG